MLTIASTAVVPVSVFLVRARIVPPSPSLLFPPPFPHSSHPTRILLPIAPFLPNSLAQTLPAPLYSYISARSSRAPSLDVLRTTNVRDRYHIPIPPSRSHSVTRSLPSSPSNPSVFFPLSRPSDTSPASPRGNGSPTHNATLALNCFRSSFLPPSLLIKCATP